MKKSMFVMAVLLILAAGSQANILTNGDFNTGDFSGWWSWSPDPATQSISIDPAGSYDSSPCAVMVSATDGTWQQLGQDVACTASTIYTLSFAYNAPQWAGAGVALKYFDANWAYLDYAWFSLSNTNGWMAWSDTFTTPATAGYLEVRFDEGSWGTMYIDNVSVTPEPATMLLLGLGGLLLRKR